MRIEYSHGLGKDTAYKRIERLLQSLKEEYGDKITDIQQTRSGNTINFDMTVQGYDIKGKIDVNDDKVTFEASLPFIVRMFSGKIEQGIRSKLEDILS